jgi:hypothetical protein
MSCVGQDRPFDPYQANGRYAPKADMMGLIPKHVPCHATGSSIIALKLFSPDQLHGIIF